MGQKTTSLTFVPTNHELLEAYEELWNETADFFGFKHSPIETVSVLVESWLRHEQATFLVSEVDQTLLSSAFELIRFLDYTKQRLHSIEFYRQEARKAVAYVEAGESKQLADPPGPETGAQGKG